MQPISVIIPVYNTEKYITKCLDSVIEQTIKGIEIIIVNDGSTDNSEQIIQEYRKQHSQNDIKYFKKENGGLASARNYGVKQATGKYISFLDSDDYIDSHLYEKLLPYMNENIDVIKFKMKTVNETGKIIEKLEGPVFETCTGEKAYQKLCVEEKFLDPACIYLYRKEFFVDYNFQYRLTYHEDFGLTSLVIINAHSFVSTDIYGYYYLQSQNSLTRSDNYEKNILRAKDVLKHYDNMIENIEKYRVTEKTKRLVKRYYTNTVVLKVETLKGKEQEVYIKEIQKRKMYQNIIPNNIKQAIKKILFRCNLKLYLKMR